MNLLVLMQARGFVPRKVSSVNGGEYHSPCPACGGRDRFSIHIGKNRYFCRQCHRTGDPIQFLREFEGRSFMEAKKLVDHYSSDLPKQRVSCDSYNHELWSQRATRFSWASNQALQRNKEALSIVQGRGITIDSIKQYCLGWSGREQWESPLDWGFQVNEKQVYLPEGIVIPFYEESAVIKLKIRRTSWYPGDKFPKYFEVRGSKQKMILLGESDNLPTMVLESELDAILMAQVAGDLCNFVALGGAMKRPDIKTHEFLKKSPLLFYSLDDDEAGRKSYGWWSAQYPNLKIWVTAGFKSPGDAHLSGIDLRRWIKGGIKSSQDRQLKNLKKTSL